MTVSDGAYFLAPRGGTEILKDIPTLRTVPDARQVDKIESRERESEGSGSSRTRCSALAEAVEGVSPRTAVLVCLRGRTKPSRMHLFSDRQPGSISLSISLHLQVSL